MKTAKEIIGTIKLNENQISNSPITNTGVNNYNQSNTYTSPDWITTDPYWIPRYTVTTTGISVRVFKDNELILLYYISNSKIYYTIINIVKDNLSEVTFKETDSLDDILLTFLG